MTKKLLKVRQKLGEISFARYWNSPTLTTYVSFIAKALSLIGILPLVVKRLPSADAAVWLLLSSISIFRGIFDSGLCPTLSRFFSYAMGGLKDPIEINSACIQDSISVEPNWNTVREIWESMQLIYLGLSILSLLLLITVGTWAFSKPISELNEPISGWIALVIVSVGFPFLLWGFRYTPFILGTNHVADLRRWEGVIHLCTCVALIMSLCFWPSLIGLTTIFYAFQVMGVWINKRISVRIGKHIVFSSINWRVNKEVLAVVWPVAWRSGLGVISSTGLWNLTGFVYSQYASAADLTMYLFSLRVVTGIGQFCQAPFYSKIPLLAILRFQNKTQKLIEISVRGMRYTYLSYVLIVTMVGWIIFAIKRSKLLDDKLYHISIVLWFLLSIAIFAERFGALHIQLLATTNKIVAHIANGVSGLIILVLLLTIPYYFGFNGFPLSFLFGYISFYCWYSARLSYQSIGMQFCNYERKTLMIYCGLFLLVNLFVAVMLESGI